ncbi:PIG-L family deacetylase [Streptomyces boncukensis]|uniref:PIG-L family deacetylase n=1 Tax=Streptomyces boncukensis TaxID=2711219 RepID=A0A6G4WRP1_9ACTN|nr:PIG-L family deacetylase [Streptomyces boncukensis]NGO67683.1 PIG-L family deacetylase [Streptomyces boncukensis]
MPLIPRAVAGRRHPGAVIAALCSISLLAGLTGYAHGQAADRSAARQDDGPPVQAAPAPTGVWAGAGAGGRVRTAESVLQVVAHPDDDLFFINPETAQSLRSGRPVTTVYLTSGESDGVNAPRVNLPGAAAPARGPSARGDRAAYAEARQNGIRSAYAEMVTGNRATPWQRRAVRTAGGGFAELDTLQGHPQVRLVWSLLREAGSITRHRPHSLYGLWRDESAALGSRLTSAGPVRRSFRYTRTQLVETLVGYLRWFRPTQIRMQDPTPGRLDRDGRYADHQDHFAGARFLQEALARYGEYAARGAVPHFTVETYLGYFNGGLPHVLGGRTARNKLRSLDTYAWADRSRRPCGAPAGCGDLKMVPGQQHRGWSHGIRHADGDSVSWLRADRGGALWAYGVLDGRIAVRHRPAGAEARWGAPVLLPRTGIDPTLATVRLREGRTALVGTRTVTRDGPAGYRKEVGWVDQRAPGPAVRSGSAVRSGFGSWESLGTPETGDPAGLSDISAPAAAVGPDGTVTVVVRTSRHQLSGRVRQPGGGWGPWRALGGSGVHGTPAAATDGAGRLYVFGATANTVLAWSAPRPGGPLTGPYATGLPAVTGPLTARADGRSAVRLSARAPVSGHVLTARLSGALPRTARGAPLRAGRVADLGGAGGYGPVAAARLPGGRTLLATRADHGDVQTAVVDERPGGAGAEARAKPAAARVRWSRTGFLAAGAPAAVPAPRGAGVDLAVEGLDGRLYWARIRGDGTTGWHRS